MNNQKSRLEYAKFQEVAPETTGALRAIGRAVSESSLEEKLVELVKLRASQINGCAFCLHMHSADAQKLGESAERMLLLSAWREAPVYSERERAALAWTEALTLISENHAPDDVYEEVCQHFSEQELALLTSAIVMINSWNRIAISYGWTPHIKPAA